MTAHDKALRFVLVSFLSIEMTERKLIRCTGPVSGLAHHFGKRIASPLRGQPWISWHLPKSWCRFTTVPV